MFKSDISRFFFLVILMSIQLYSEFFMLTAYIATISKCITYGMSVLFTGDLTETVDVVYVLSLRFAISIRCLKS